MFPLPDACIVSKSFLEYDLFSAFLSFLVAEIYPPQLIVLFTVPPALGDAFSLLFSIGVGVLFIDQAGT